MRIRVLLPASLVAMLLLPTAAVALPEGTKVERYARKFGGQPIDMAWVPGSSKVFVTERSGAIRVLNNGRVLNKACGRLNVTTAGERGLLGIAVDPNFKNNKRLYVYYTNASPVQNRVARFKVVNNDCRNRKVIVKGLASSSSYHNGGQLTFAGGKLFVSVGEAHDPARAQNTNSREGKILRINTDGSVPSGNPFDNAVWSYGHRNPFGLTTKPGTQKIYSSENGPSCDDEMNHIRKGRNYGWGSGYQCGTAGVGPNPKAPIRRWSNIIVPTDPAWYKGKMNALSNDLYVGAYGDGALHRLVMNRKGTKVKQDRVIYNAESGIYDVSKGPGGWLYFIAGGAIYRIVPQ
jgi:glucose/arabinose dehydrogenase